LRDVVAEQLADLTRDLVWTCRERIDPEEAFRSDGAGEGAIRIAIELRAETEARLTLGDTRSDRFVVRRVPLRNGLDEVGREQLGQIVRFSTLALRSGSSQTLSRTEARAAVASWTASLLSAKRRTSRRPAAARAAVGGRRRPDLVGLGFFARDPGRPGAGARCGRAWESRRLSGAGSRLDTVSLRASRLIRSASRSALRRRASVFAVGQRGRGPLSFGGAPVWVGPRAIQNRSTRRQRCSRPRPMRSGAPAPA
jgi:hypothetical protein